VPSSASPLPGALRCIPSAWCPPLHPLDLEPRQDLRRPAAIGELLPAAGRATASDPRAGDEKAQ
jgi:hypothetical protein